MKRVADKAVVLVAFLAVLVAPLTFAVAQDFGFEAPVDATDPALPAALRDLAERVVPVYAENHPERYLANLAALQMVAGDPVAARESRLSLQERLRSEQGDAAREGRAIVYDVYTQARAIEATEHVLFTSAYGQAFRDTLDRFDDFGISELEASFNTPLASLRNTLQHALDERRGKDSITLDEALELVRDWFAFEAYRSFGDVARLLFAEEKQRRYSIDEVMIPVAQGAKIAATLVRPHAASGATLPTLLEFTLDRSHRDAVEPAAHGYVSVLALSRVRGDPKMRPRAPFESDGDDARAVIEWVAKQPWSDGRVAMQGAGYGGFVAWSAAKRLPPALKAIATSDPVAPGISLPMANGVFLSSAYRWAHETLGPADKVVNDAARWRRIEEDWFRSGRPYRELATLPGRASAVFQSWLNHPSYDRFWQKWLPFGDEFARVDIPVLTVAGYYSGEESAALYFFTQHHEQDAGADHALLIGPLNEKGLEQGTRASEGDLPLDAEAHVDLKAVRYAWFDYALRGAKRPPLLAANVNYELAGANEWRHEPSLDAVEQNARRFYFADAPNGAAHALVGEKPSAPMALTQTLDLRDRTGAEWRPAPDLVRKGWQPRDGALFISEPFEDGIDFVGRLRGVLDFTINKYDVDLVLQLYEVRANGEYVKLFEPAYTFRASYARDRVHRRLLAAGVRQQVPFQSQRMMGHRLKAGSRLALAIAINKRADQQVNYGGEGDVSEESVDDAGAPVRVRWHEGSFIDVPAR